VWESGFRVLLLLAAAASFGHLLSWISAIAAMVTALVLDLRHPLSFRNFFLAYLLVVFGVGAQHFAPGDLTGSVDLLIFAIAFLASYAGIRRWFPRKADKASQALIDTRLPTLLVLFVSVGWVALLVSQIGTYGFRGFYSGAALAQRIAKYGHLDFANGLLSLIEQGLAILTLASVVLYIKTRVDAGKKPSYLLLSLPLIVAPLLLLRRYEFAMGLLLMLALQPIAARLCRARYSIVASIPLIAGSIILAFAVSVMVGSLRETAVAPTKSAARTEPSAAQTPGAAPDTTSTVPVSVTPISRAGADVDAILKNVQGSMTEQRTWDQVYSEMSPIVAYLDIREHPDDFTYRLGSTILPPLLAKVVPRSWLPEKPIGSGAYYNQTRTPGAFASGYALPVTIFGDGLLSFGLVGAVAAAAGLGLLTSRLDGLLDAQTSHGLPMFLIVFYNFYSLLRTDLANSVSVILLTGLIFTVLDRVLHLWIAREASPGANLRLSN
jgi:hypothetical protein